MKALLRTFSIIHGLMAILFACAALMLIIIIAAKVGWLFAIDLLSLKLEGHQMSGALIFKNLALAGVFIY